MPKFCSIIFLRVWANFFNQLALNVVSVPHGTCDDK